MTLNKIWITIFFFFLIVSAQAGQKGSGGDILTTRFLLARDNAVKVMEILSGTQRGDSSRIVVETYTTHRQQWIHILKNLHVVPVEEKLFEGKIEKAALAFPGEQIIKLNLPYMRQIQISSDEAFVLAVHESGHLIGIKDHDLLDQTGYYLLRNAPSDPTKIFNHDEYQKSVERIAALALLDVKVIQYHILLPLEEPGKSRKICIALGAYITSLANLINFGLAGDSTQMRKDTIKQIATISASTLTYCGLPGKIAMFESNEVIKDIQTLSQKLQQIEELTTKIKTGEIK